MTGLAGLADLLHTRSLAEPAPAVASDRVPESPVLSDVSVIKVGGQCLMDRGRTAGVRSVQVVNGLVPGTLTRALAGTAGVTVTS